MSVSPVLIVEDNEMNMKLCCDLLEAHGIPHIKANSGQEALKLAKEDQPSLILLDVQLPDISGEEVLKCLKSDIVLNQIPVIAITAFASPLDESRLKSLGCNDYLPKPLTIESFFGVLMPFIDGWSRKGDLKYPMTGL